MPSPNRPILDCSHDLTFITGWGKGSENNDPRIRPAIVEMLNAEFEVPQNAYILPDNPGRVGVKGEKALEWARELKTMVGADRRESTEESLAESIEKVSVMLGAVHLLLLLFMLQRFLLSKYGRSSLLKYMYFFSFNVCLRILG